MFGRGSDQFFALASASASSSASASALFHYHHTTIYQYIYLWALKASRTEYCNTGDTTYTKYHMFHISNPLERILFYNMWF